MQGLLSCRNHSHLKSIKKKKALSVLFCFFPHRMLSASKGRGGFCVSGVSFLLHLQKTRRILFRNATPTWECLTHGPCQCGVLHQSSLFCWSRYRVPTVCRVSNDSSKIQSQIPSSLPLDYTAVFTCLSVWTTPPPPKKKKLPYFFF